MGLGATCSIPWIVALWMRLARCCPHLCGLLEHAFVLAMFLVGCAGIAVVTFTYDCLYRQGLETVGGVSAFAFAGLCSMLLTRIVYKDGTLSELAKVLGLNLGFSWSLRGTHDNRPCSTSACAIEGADGACNVQGFGRDCLWRA